MHTTTSKVYQFTYTYVYNVSTHKINGSVSEADMPSTRDTFLSSVIINLKCQFSTSRSWILFYYSASVTALSEQLTPYWIATSRSSSQIHRHLRNRKFQYLYYLFFNNAISSSDYVVSSGTVFTEHGNGCRRKWCNLLQGNILTSAFRYWGNSWKTSG
jgi:hypothetical protein